MRQLTAIFLIALVGFTIAAKSNQSPADAVLGRIDELVQSSRDEQAEQTRIWTSQHERCEVEQAFRDQEIKDAALAASAADQQLQVCNVEVPVAAAASDESKAELVATEQQQVQLEKQYKVFSAANTDRAQQHQDALNNIGAAYNIIGQFANGKAALNSNADLFVEVAQRLNKIFRTAIKHKFHKKMVPVMTALVQVTQNPAVTVSTESLTRVIGLFRQLEADVRQSEANRVDQWASYENLYNIQDDLLQDQVDALNVIIGKYAVYLQNLAACQRIESAILSLAQAKFQRNSDILASTNVMCAAYDGNFKLQTQQRSDYVALLGQLRSFVVSAISSFNSGEYSHNDFVDQKLIQKASKKH